MDWVFFFSNLVLSVNKSEHFICWSLSDPKRTQNPKSGNPDSMNRRIRNMKHSPPHFPCKQGRCGLCLHSQILLAIIVACMLCSIYIFRTVSLSFCCITVGIAVKTFLSSSHSVTMLTSCMSGSSTSLPITTWSSATNLTSWSYQVSCLRPSVTAVTIITTNKVGKKLTKCPQQMLKYITLYTSPYVT